jgi:hypothetical protein
MEGVTQEEVLALFGQASVKRSTDALSAFVNGERHSRGQARPRMGCEFPNQQRELFGEEDVIRIQESQYGPRDLIPVFEQPTARVFCRR